MFDLMTQFCYHLVGIQTKDGKGEETYAYRQKHRFDRL